MYVGVQNSLWKFVLTNCSLHHVRTGSTVAYEYDTYIPVNVINNLLSSLHNSLRYWYQYADTYRYDTCTVGVHSPTYDLGIYLYRAYYFA
jgi:hypothetical protein